ncbi:nematocyst expressed protein 3-like [Macrobrachium rosenbergii]|uniref:nematocyst expressed protein 3-like n=1 Tax=Macrobrachium rosenbergii TaxID=79674 RepID=UPI0034D74171
MPGTPRGLDLPGPPSALSDINSLPAALASTGQCQAPPSLSGCSLPSVLPEPGPELVPVPDPERDSDPPTRDPPDLTTVIIPQCEPPTPDVSSSHTLPPAEDDPLADLDGTSFLVNQELSGQDADAGSLPTTVVAVAEVGDQPLALEAAPDPAPDGTPGHSSESELSGQDADAGSLPTTVVAAAEVGDQPIALEAAPDPAPDGTPGRSLESVSSSPPTNGLARPWRPPKKKKGRKKLA